MPYDLVLAAIGPLDGLIGGHVFGFRFLAATFRPPLDGAIVSALMSYVLTLAAIYIVALVIDALAPTFGGQKNPIQALRSEEHTSEIQSLMRHSYAVFCL